MRYVQHSASKSKRRNNYENLSKNLNLSSSKYDLSSSIRKNDSIYNTPSKTRSTFNTSGYGNSSALSPTRSPMRGNEEEHLVRALKQQIINDREIEEIKKQLALKNDFNLLDAFREFDSTGKGFISRLDLELALNDIGIFPSRDELYLIF